MKITPNMVKKLIMLFLCGYSLLEAAAINDDRKEKSLARGKRRKGQQETATVPEIALRVLIMALLIIIIIKYWTLGINLLLQLLFKIWAFIDALRWGVITGGSALVSLKHAGYALILWLTSLAAAATGFGAAIAPILVKLAIDEGIESALWAGLSTLTAGFNLMADQEFGSPTKYEEECAMKCFSFCANTDKDGTNNTLSYLDDEGIRQPCYDKDEGEECACGLETLKNIAGDDTFGSGWDAASSTLEAVTKMVSGFANIIPF